MDEQVEKLGLDYEKRENELMEIHAQREQKLEDQWTAQFEQSEKQHVERFEQTAQENSFVMNETNGKIQALYDLVQTLLNLQNGDTNENQADNSILTENYFSPNFDDVDRQGV